MTSLLLLSPSKPNKELFLYLTISPMAISSTMIQEEDCVQLPVYYTSRALKGAKERYPPMEKLAFALIAAARKFKPYFQAHTIVVLWVIELSQFNIRYCPRTAIKAQALADFIAEFTTSKIDDQGETLQKIQTNGLSNKRAREIRVVLQSPERSKGTSSNVPSNSKS